MIPGTKVVLISTDVYKMRNYFYSIELFRFLLVIVDKGQKKAPTTLSRGSFFLE